MSESPLKPSGRVVIEGRRPGQIPWGIVLGVASLVSLVALFYYYNYRKDVTGERARILKERKRLAEDISADYGTMRAKVEPWTIELATKPFTAEYVDAEAKNLTWRERPSIYLHVRAEEAKTPDELHAASKLSSLDGISSCLLRVKGSYGPWGWGEIVARAEMLGSDFTADVRDTDNDLRLRNLAYALDQYRLNDFPFARDGLRMAEYVIIAVDEDPAQVPSSSLAFGADASIAQKIASVPHPIRLAVHRLTDGKQLLRVRRTPDAQVLQVQGDPTAPGAGLEIRRLQALGCAMANEALEAAGADTGPAMAASGSPLPIATPSPAPSGSTSAAPSGSTSGAPAAPSSSAPPAPAPSAAPSASSSK